MARVVRGRGGRAALLLFLGALGACHRYVPLHPAEDLGRGARIRVHLSVPGDYRLFDLTANNIVLIDGEFVRWQETALVLSASWLESASGREYKAESETLFVPLEHVARIEERKVSAAKTAGLLGFGVAALAMGLGALEGVGSSGRTGPPPVPPK